MERDKALDIVRKNYPHVTQSGSQFETALRTLIPELKESEDERIRKYIIHVLCDCGYKYNEHGERDKALAWLEKQGEQNSKSADFIPTDYTSDAKNENRWHKVEDSLPDNAREVLCKDAIGNFFIGRYYNDGDYWEVSMYDEPDKSNKDNPPVIMWANIPSSEQNLANSAKTCKDEPKFPSLSEKEIVCLKRILDFLREEHNSYTGKDFTNEIAVLEWLITHPVLMHSSELQLNQGWQKPAWSEEDEIKCMVICDWLCSNSSSKFKGFRSFELSDWLKSLKERYTWKPSDEQMECLLNTEGVLRAESRIAMAQMLSSLYNDLKKLKG